MLVVLKPIEAHLRIFLHQSICLVAHLNLVRLSHNGTKAELGVCGRGANWAKNGSP
jgi:hypothetical protein